MPARKPKNLHFADSVEELQTKADLNKAALVSKQTSKLIKSADKILKEAEKYYKSKDEEMAYIFYFKFIDLMILLSDRKDDTSKEPLWPTLSKVAPEAMEIAKTLKSSLIKRYSEAHRTLNGPKVATKLLPVLDEQDNKTEVNSNSVDRSYNDNIKSTLPDPEKFNLVDDTIIASDLYEIMTESKYSFVVMDVRSMKDFDESHIKHSGCVSVPSEILHPGITSTNLEQALPLSSKAKWLERGNVDYVILMDWNTENVPLLEQNSLRNLQDAITKWDLHKPLKRPPIVLKGGYKEWVLRYPMYCTKALDILSLENNDTCLITDVSDIDYPDFDDTVIVMDKNRKNMTPPVNTPRPLFSRDTKPREQMNNVFTKITNFDTSVKLNDKPNSAIDISSIQTFQPAILNHTKEIVKPETVKPDFDRSLKPIKTLNKSFGQAETLFQSPQIAIKTEKDNDHSSFKEIKNEENKVDIKKEEQLPHVAKVIKQENNETIVKPSNIEKAKFLEDGDSIKSEPKSLNHEKFLVKKHPEHPEFNKIFNDCGSPKGNHKSDEYIAPLKEEGSGSRGLTRSFSSPNIADLIPGEGKRVLPTIDRTTKPKMDRIFPPVTDNVAIVRNLNPIYGHCPARPVTGLKNLGNTCYMNAVIQCLSNTEQLSFYFTSEQYRQHLKKRPGSSCEVAEDFAVVIRALWMGTYKSIAPRDLKNCLAKYIPMCAGNEQQDSHEFLMLLFDKLHNELNQGREADPLPDLDNLPVAVATEKFWNHYRVKNKSKISDLFEGLLKSTLKCSSCETTSTSYEVFSCLSLPISSNRSVKECLEGFLKSEKMFGDGAWLCPGCKQKKEAEKILTICKFPSILIIQLKRFSYIGMWKEKLQTTIKYQSTLDVEGKVYDLYGIVNHVGCLEGGHYTACCKNPSSSDWYKYDDHEASKVFFSEIPTSAAYMFFYILRDMKSR